MVYAAGVENDGATLNVVEASDCGFDDAGGIRAVACGGAPIHIGLPDPKNGSSICMDCLLQGVVGVGPYLEPTPAARACYIT